MARKPRITAAALTEVKEFEAPPEAELEAEVDEEAGQPLPPIGHNNPPKPEVNGIEEIKAWLDHDTQPLVDRFREIMVKHAELVARGFKVDSIETQGRAGDLREAIRKFINACDARRKVEKEPYLEGGRAVDAFFKRLTDQIDETSRLSVHQIDEIYRQQQEEYAKRLAAESRRLAQAEAEKAAKLAAEKLAEAQAAIATQAPEAAVAQDEAIIASQVAEKAEAHAAAPAAQHSRVYGDGGSVTSLRTTWTYEITSRQALFAAAAGMPAKEKFAEWLVALREIHAHVEGAPERLVDWLIGELEQYPARTAPVEAAYVVPDEVRIRRAVVSDKVRSIPGVRIFADESVR